MATDLTITNFKDLIDVDEKKFKVNGRTLHAALTIGGDYRHWMRRMCDYGFEEGEDFNVVIFDRVETEGSRTVTRSVETCMMTIDMAKEICMIQRSETGRRIRKYFIDCEKQLKESQVALIPNFSNPAEAARAWADQYEARLKAESENKLLAPKANYTDNVLSSEGYMTATQIAKDYGKSAKWLNKLLHVEGIQYKSGNQWILYAKYADKGYTVSGTCVVGDNSYVSTYCTQEGRKFIYDLIKEKYGLTPRNEE